MGTNKKSFTLIEMLIVIVIIGILAAALVPRLISVQGRARDTERKAELSQIVTAMEIYRVDYTKYPDIQAYTFSTGNQPWIPALSGIMTTIPQDPRNNAGLSYVTGNYSYGVLSPFSPTFHKYTLFGQLESTTDPDRCFIKRYVFHEVGGSYTVCGNFSSQIYAVGPYSLTGS